ncbi:MAG TPA: hypothetical protein VEL74_05760 [Thermoanaerobaculia bacterium]|nr:hypothetical protein [Thermoanaerobaculia bacterium]
MNGKLVRFLPLLTLLMGSPAWPQAPLQPIPRSEGRFCNACVRPQVPLRVELVWDGEVDLDLWVAWDRFVAYYDDKTGGSATGRLDCDVQKGGRYESDPACRGETENFYATSAPAAPGRLLYRFAVHHYDGEGGDPVPWRARVTLFETRHFFCSGVFDGEAAAGDVGMADYLKAGSRSGRLLGFSPVFEIVLPSPGAGAVPVANCEATVPVSWAEGGRR